MEYSRLSPLTNEVDAQQRATAFTSWAICKDSYFSDDPVRTFRERGFSRFVKSDVPSMLSTDEAVSGLPLRTAFVALVDRQSILGALVARGALQFPLAGAARLQVGTMVATATAEGDSKPVGRLDFTLAGAPTKVEASIVVSADALRSFDPATQTGIRDILVSACAAATDTTLVSTLTAGSPAGSAAIGDLLAGISGGAPARPALIAGYDVLLGLEPGVVRDLQALGIAIVPTPAAAGLLVAVDCAGLLLADEGAEIQTARHADIALSEGGSPEGSTVANLWQRNLAAVRCERWLRLSIRAGAVAYASGSPA